MKTSYFTQPEADLDDHVLTQMIAESRVPRGCLWGGILVQEAALMGEDPCALCPCPRRLQCGGRPQKEAKIAEPVPNERVGRELVRVSNDEAGARRLIRKQWIREITRSLIEAEKEIGS